MRPDGTRVKDIPPIVAAIPYIMPKRYDAQNTITEYIDEELVKSYIREKRRGGVRINHMALLIAAYYRAVLYNPKLNYFVMNSRIYRRNHFCVSFVILKKLPDGRPDETTLKIYLTPEDTIFSIQQKITDAIKETLERTPPELSADIIDRGITLTGGGALLRGLDQLIQSETGIDVHIAEDPLDCVAKGAGAVLDHVDVLHDVLDTDGGHM